MKLGALPCEALLGGPARERQPAAAAADHLVLPGVASGVSV